MKKCLIGLVFLIACTCLYGQDTNNTLTLSAAFHTDATGEHRDYKLESGMGASLFFDHTFSEHFGMYFGASSFKGKFTRGRSYWRREHPWTFTLVEVGPMFILTSTDRNQFYLRLNLGYVSGGDPDSVSGFAPGLTIGGRYYWPNNVGLSVEGSYYKTMPENPQACLWDEWHPIRAGVFRGRPVP